jgi:hypothetical protein
MSDLNHTIYSDLVTSGTGDLATVSGTDMGKQRVLRRLLTNPGDYPFHPSYGAGLARMVGDVADVGRIKALVRGQMLLEESVSPKPEPSVSVTLITGGVTCSIRYTDANSNQTVALSFNVTT